MTVDDIIAALPETARALMAAEDRVKRAEALLADVAAFLRRQPCIADPGTTQAKLLRRIETLIGGDGT